MSKKKIADRKWYPAATDIEKNQRQLWIVGR